MGPRNVGVIQSKLRELRDVMGWPERVPAIMTAELEQSAEADLLTPPIIADASPVLAAEPIVEPTGADEVP